MNFGNIAAALAQRAAQAAAGYTGGQVAALQAKQQLAMTDANRRFQMALLGLREDAINGRQDNSISDRDKRAAAAQAAQDARQTRQLENARRLVQLRANVTAGKPLSQAQVNAIVGNYVEATYSQNDADATDLEARAAQETDPGTAQQLRAQAQQLRSPRMVAAMAQQAFAGDAMLDPTTKGLVGNPMVATTFAAQAQRLLTRRKTALEIAAGLLGTAAPAPAGAGPINNGTPAPPRVPAPAPAPAPASVGKVPQPSLFTPTPADIERAAKDKDYDTFLRSLGWNGQHAAPADSTALP